MSLQIASGSRLRSSVCDVEVIVIKAPAEAVDLRCGGVAMVPIDQPRPQDMSAQAGFDNGTLLGKRYTDASGELELLCTKAGSSTLSVGDQALEVKSPKPLPSSD